MTIRRIVAVAAMLLAVSIPHAYAQNAISLGQILFDGVPVTNDSVPVSITQGLLEFQLRIQVDAGVDSHLGGTTNGFRVYSTGVSWTSTSAEFLPPGTPRPTSIS